MLGCVDIKYTRTFDIPSQQVVAESLYVNEFFRYACYEFDGVRVETKAGSPGLFSVVKDVADMVKSFFSAVPIFKFSSKYHKAPDCAKFFATELQVNNSEESK